MKQHVTQIEWDTLSDSAKASLSEWIRLGSNNAALGTEWRKEFEITIGQMIEFLFDNDFGPIITSNDTAFYWIVEPDKKLDCWSRLSFESSELSDALWQAMKEVLEK